MEPSFRPTRRPTYGNDVPTPEPTQEPTAEPTAEPTVEPTAEVHIFTSPILIHLKLYDYAILANSLFQLNGRWLCEWNRH